MKKIILLFCLSVFFSSVYGQLLEVGAGVGVLHYKGDVTPRFKPFMVRPGANIFFRYNISRAVSFKVGGMIGSFYGDDKKVDDPLQQARDYRFSTAIKEGYGQVEYNFLNFRTNASRIVSEWTPYVFGGVGYASTKTTSFVTDTEKNIVIPFGIGFKKKWNNNWNWGVEFGTRKTFSDGIDNLGDTPKGLNSSSAKDKLQQGLDKNTDMYYYTSFSISYVFYKIECPVTR